MVLESEQRQYHFLSQLPKLSLLFVIGGICVCLGVFMLLFTRGSFGTLWRTDKKFIIKTKAFETKREDVVGTIPSSDCRPNPGQILLKALERSENREVMSNICPQK